MIAETTGSEQTVLITALFGAITTLAGTTALLFKLLIKEKDARIKAASEVKESAKKENGDE